jgi:peptidoglycan/LPS O-acetylase OafA/YrhL
VIGALRGNAAEGRTASTFDLRAFDGLRGLAALYIVAHHARLYLWEGSHRALASGGFPAIVAFATVPLRYGAEVVLVFFLLSGFVIHLRQARSLARGETPSFRAISFFRRRATRLVPPLLFALVLTAALDAVGSGIAPSIYQASDAGRSVFAFAMNALFLQGFASPTFGSNSALWSLSYEAIFYALYPLLLIARVRFGARAAFGGIFAFGVCGSAVHVASPAIVWTIAPYFAIWSLGALVAEAFANGVTLPHPVVLLATGAALLLPSAVSPGALDPTVQSGIFAVGMALLMALFVLHPAGLGLASQFARLRGLGARSYTLYVVHTPLLFCMAALWLRTRGQLPESGLLMPLGIAAAVALAFVVAPFVELPFSARAKLRAVSGGPASRARTGVATRGVPLRVEYEEVADEGQAA